MDQQKKAFLRQNGFGAEVDRIEAGRCSLCDQEVKQEDLRDESSRREFEISGMCMKCQDDFFGG